MHSIATKLVVFWFFTGWGLIVLALGFLGLAVVLALLRNDTTGRPFTGIVMEEACEIESSLANPSTIGLEGRVRRFITVDTAAIDFRALPDRWRHVCLTSVESGGISLGGSYRPPFMNFQRSLCWGWSPDTITVLLIEENGATFPFQMKLRDVTGRSPLHWLSDQCSQVKEAVARCGPSRFGSSWCAFEPR